MVYNWLNRPVVGDTSNGVRSLGHHMLHLGELLKLDWEDLVDDVPVDVWRARGTSLGATVDPSVVHFHDVHQVSQAHVVHGWLSQVVQSQVVEEVLHCLVLPTINLFVEVLNREHKSNNSAINVVFVSGY